ncbi:MAG: triose-phosphate isomerase [Bacilli bacterium]
MRNKLLLGNWKMNKTNKEALEFASSMDEVALKAKENHIDIGVAPTYLSLKTVKDNAPKSMIVSAQNVHFVDHGAFTGEVSIPMLLELGIDWVIIGHSERRTYDNETDDKCNKKIKELLNNNMVPVYCVGETLEQFEKGETKQVVKTQVVEGLKDLDKNLLKTLVIAYEPVWSIGTGKNASKEIAEDVCSYIRDIVGEMYGEAKEDVRILYGGSVKPENARAYLSMPNVDGALVGGASLKVDSFKALLDNII